MREYVDIRNRMRIITSYKNAINGRSDSTVARIVGGTSWVMIGSVLSKILVFFATIMVARILSKEVYGQLSIIRSTIALFVSLSSFGIGATATRYIAEYRKSNPQKAIKMYYVANSFVWVMAIVSSILLMCCAKTLAANRLHCPEMAIELWIASVILFFTLLNGAQTGTLSGFEDFKRIAKCQVLMGITEIIALCTGAYLFGLKGAVIGFGLTYCIAWIYNSIGIQHHLRLLEIPITAELRHLHFTDFKPLLSFSLPVAATSWIQMIVYWWLKTSVISGAGFENMANYDVAEQWRTQIAFVPGLVATVVLPILSNVNHEKESRRKVIRTNFFINVGITGLLAVIISILGSMVLKLYGNQYTNLIPLYFLCFCSVFDSISNLSGTILMSTEKVIWALFTNMLWAISLFGAYNFLSTTGYPLENVLACSYFCAAFIQSIIILTVIKYLHLY